MANSVTPEIRRVDDTLCSLVDYRSRCENPIEVLQAMERIDRCLDERLVLMRNQDGNRTLQRS